MIKRLLASAALAGTLALGGCATGSTTTSSQVVAEAQAIAQKVCGYLPTAETVLDIFLSGNAAYSTGTSIANAICTAVTSKSAVRGRSAPKVAGVTVKGRFVR